MLEHIDKPDDFDSVIHGEDTRFVIFEKREDISKNFLFKMRKYWRVSSRILLNIFTILKLKKTEKQ